jgi:hypothetical protein
VHLNRTSRRLHYEGIFRTTFYLNIALAHKFADANSTNAGRLQSRQSNGVNDLRRRQWLTSLLMRIARTLVVNSPANQIL